MKFDVKSIITCGKRNAPKMLIWAGTIGLTGAGVWGCAKTRKLDPVIETHKKKLEEVKKKDPENKKGIAKVYFDTAGQVFRVYRGPLLVAIISATEIITGERLFTNTTAKLLKENAALAAAYTGLQETLIRYRERVREKYGEEAEQEIYEGSHLEKIEVEEDGKTVKKKLPVMGNDLPSPYARYFCMGETSAAEANFEYNLHFLGLQQELANRMLIANGYFFLNDVFEMLGYPRSVAGQIVGWTYDKNGKPDGDGDNRIDFRIRTVYRKMEVGDCYEKVLMIDPNVDGVILNEAQDKGLITE